MSNLTVNDILNKREVGSVIPLLVEIKDEQIPIIFIKEYEEYINSIKDNTIVTVKSAVISDKKVDLFLLMLKFKENYLYDIWFNYGIEWNREFLNQLMISNRLLLDFRNENNDRIKTIQIDNTIVEEIIEYISKCERLVLVKGKSIDNVILIERKNRYECWDEDDVYNLMENVLYDYDSIEELWDSI